jgi:uncharacterized protein with ATP-grasp and redox domains
MNTYNGWTNYATWLFYLHYQQEVENWYQDYDDEQREHLDESDLQGYFEEMYGELIDGIANIYLTDEIGKIYLTDVIGNEMREINWREILKTLRKDDEPIVDSWTEETALSNYLDHVAENKNKERN